MQSKLDKPEAIIEIPLETDWDEGVSAPSIQSQARRGHFCGRYGEMRALETELQTKTSGSILVAGHRGVGKTSLVYQALQNAIEKNTKFLPVTICAPHLEIEVANGPTPDKKTSLSQDAVIKNLIRRLYSTTRSHKGLCDELKRSTETLYRKAIAREFSLSEQNRTSDSTSIEDASTAKLHIHVNLANAIPALTGFIAAWLLWLFGSLPGLPTWLSILLRGISALPLLVGASMVLYRREKSRARRNLSERTSDEVYSFDGCTGNLVADLESLHSEFVKKGFSLVYVIDEVDKIDLIEALRAFKSLFTLSQALFVFVSGEEAFKAGIPSSPKGDGLRDPLYTYFTSRYYISRPLWSDLKAYMDEVMQPSKTVDRADLETIQRALAFAADNDIFDLKARIRDHITDIRDNRPVLRFHFDSAIREQAAAHTLATLVYEKYVRQEKPSSWQENENALRNIFSEMRRVIALPPGGAITTMPDTLSARDAKHCLHYALWRCGAAEIGVIRTQSQSPGVPSKRQLTYKGSIPDVSISIFSLNANESRYLSALRKLGCAALGALNTIQVLRGSKPYTELALWQAPDKALARIQGLGYDWLQALEPHLYSYHVLIARPPGRIDTSELSRHEDSLKRNWPDAWSLLPQVMTQVMAQSLPGLTSGSTSFNTQQPSVQKLDASVRESLIACHPYAISNRQGEKTAVILGLSPNTTPDFLEQLDTGNGNLHYFVMSEAKLTVPSDHCSVFILSAPDKLATELPRLGTAVNRHIFSDEQA